MSVGDGQVIRKLKILCLHGYRQNGNVFRTKLGAFRKIVSKLAELVFITAELPAHEIPEETTESGEVKTEMNDQCGCGWWFSMSDNSFNAHDRSDICTGFEKSVDTVKMALKENGYFDGVLGFSQGAAFAALLFGLQQQGRECFGFKFAIIIAGFKSRSTQHSQLYEQVIDCPSLHVFGETDRIIPKEMSEELILHFNSPVLLRHPGGHFAPATAHQKKDYLEFLEKMLKHVNQC